MLKKNTICKLIFPIFLEFSVLFFKENFEVYFVTLWYDTHLHRTFFFRENICSGVENYVQETQSLRGYTALARRLRTAICTNVKG